MNILINTIILVDAALPVRYAIVRAAMDGPAIRRGGGRDVRCASFSDLFSATITPASSLSSLAPYQDRNGLKSDLSNGILQR